ncbi:hypothetical protein LO772_18510 [Yinghuangia sp. ASG 101]|nr:hypothetical protein [Yinghuangia sp. ASG 101]UGQ15697.1 hypothetical protein LO772_18510 [Yinghuangia sp. ASG 101]
MPALDQPRVRELVERGRDGSPADPERHPERTFGRQSGASQQITRAHQRGEGIGQAVAA